MTTSESIVARPSGQDFEPLTQFHSEEFDRLSNLEKVRIFNVPSWVVTGGFIEYVLAARYFAQHGSWPNGRKPRRPTMMYLKVWQMHWIRHQHNPEAMASRKAKRSERKAKRAQETLIQELATLGHEMRLPIAITPLGHFVALRGRKARAA